MFGLSLASNCRHFDARSTNFEASSLAYCPSKEESISNSIFFPLIKSSAWNSKKKTMKREILRHKLQIYHNKTSNKVSLSSHYVIRVALFDGAGNQVPSNSGQLMVSKFTAMHQSGALLQYSDYLPGGKNSKRITTTDFPNR
jgi:hypothetical protein